MKRDKLSIVFILVGLLIGCANPATPNHFSQSTPTCNMPTTPFCNALMPPLPGWPGHIFELSQNYPPTVTPESYPWATIDPSTQPEQYIKAVLAYFYQGNIRADVEDSFDPKLNTTRGWYNAPWQDQGTNGREFVHGLTRERVSLPGELDPKQTSKWNNYAVGYYNNPGGYTIGDIWADHGNPKMSSIKMPEGTVAGKLLFTTANTDEVPYLAGAPTWRAYVYKDVHNPNPVITDLRAIIDVHLLQIDIAVKDAAHSPRTGWVFGTFVYGGGPGGSPGNGWTHVYPIGLMWGNGIVGKCDAGSECWLNKDVDMPHLGYQGRLNGPVDNPKSSCISCHSTAQIPNTTPMVPPAGVDPAPWFRDIPSGQSFDPNSQSMDYSLQIEVGLNNFIEAKKVLAAPNPQARAQLEDKLQKWEKTPPRDDAGPPP